MSYATRANRAALLLMIFVGALVVGVGLLLS